MFSWLTSSTKESNHLGDDESNTTLRREGRRYGLQHLQKRYESLSRKGLFQGVSERVIVENIRSVSEILIYGDQHTEQLFDYFCEKNMLALFLDILEQPQCSNRVKVQIIQTVSIIVQNIRNETSLYYILSNNHINQLISHAFDFEDEELLAYYISLLKTLSLKLNPNTIQFFFNDRVDTLPLYEEAIKLFDHSEGMIRTAVRTITLNIFKIDDPLMRTFVIQGPPARYFDSLAENIQSCYHHLHTKLEQFERFVLEGVHSHSSIRALYLKIEVALTEIQDNFAYIEDIFNLRFEEYEEVLVETLMKHLFWPILSSCFLDDRNEEIQLPTIEESGLSKDSISKSCSTKVALGLFTIAQTFFTISNSYLLNVLVKLLFISNKQGFYNQIMTLRLSKGLEGEKNVPHDAPDQSYKGSEKLECEQRGISQRRCFLDLLQSDDERIVLGAVCILFGICKNRSISKALLHSCDLLSSNQRRANKLLLRLTCSSSSQNLVFKTGLEANVDEELRKTLREAENDLVFRPANPCVPKQTSDIHCDNLDSSLGKHMASQTTSHFQKATRIEENKRFRSSSFDGFSMMEPKPYVKMESNSGKARRRFSAGICDISLEYTDQEKPDYPAFLVSFLLRNLKRNMQHRPITQRAVAELLVEYVVDDVLLHPCLIPAHMQLLNDSFRFAVDKALVYADVLEADNFLELALLAWEDIRDCPLKVEKILVLPYLLITRGTCSKIGVGCSSLFDGLVPAEAKDPTSPLEDARNAIANCMIMKLLQSTINRDANPQIGKLIPLSCELEEGQRIKVEDVEYVKVRVLGASSDVNVKEVYLVLKENCIALVEPESKNRDCGLVKSVMPLLFTNIGVDHLDPRQIHISVRSQNRIGWGRKEYEIPSMVLKLLTPKAGMPRTNLDNRMKSWFITLMFYDHTTSSLLLEDLERRIRFIRHKRLNEVRNALRRHR